MRSDFLSAIFQDSNYSILPLPQDASTRRYFRIISDENSFILKEYDPSNYDPEDFIKITELLKNNKISVPEIYKQDIDRGFMLIKDLGHNTVKDVLKENSDTKSITNIYFDIVNLMLELQKVDIKNLNKHHDVDVMMEGIKLFINFYPKYIGVNISDKEIKEFLHTFKILLENFNFFQKCFVHRDFHVENIILKDGTYSIIDYQDASIGSPLYDLVSLVEDARIEVDSCLKDEIVEYYCKQNNIDINSIKNEFDLLATQRNLRILGVFSYHKVKNDNDKYLQFIPRVLNYLKKDLSNPMLTQVSSFLQSKGIII